MTKMVSVRVIVPVDDEATVPQVQGRLRMLLETAGTEKLIVDGEEVGTNGRPARVHWGAADVRQYNGERAAPTPRRSKVVAPALPHMSKA